MIYDKWWIGGCPAPPHPKYWHFGTKLQTGTTQIIRFKGLFIRGLSILWVHPLNSRRIIMVAMYTKPPLCFSQKGIRRTGEQTNVINQKHALIIWRCRGWYPNGLSGGGPQKTQLYIWVRAQGVDTPREQQAVSCQTQVVGQLNDGCCKRLISTVWHRLIYLSVQICPFNRLSQWCASGATNLSHAQSFTKCWRTTSQLFGWTVGALRKFKPSWSVTWFSRAAQWLRGNPAVEVYMSVYQLLRPTLLSFGFRRELRQSQESWLVFNQQAMMHSREYVVSII